MCWPPEMTKNLAAFAIFPFALAYSGITAPFRGANEYNHFFRAYQVSIGQMIAHHAAFGVVGEELAASWLTLARAAADFPRLSSIASFSAQFRAANRVAKESTLDHTQLGRRKGG
jgi:hypothetical protein